MLIISSHNTVTKKSTQMLCFVSPSPTLPKKNSHDLRLFFLPCNFSRCLRTFLTVCYFAYELKLISGGGLTYCCALQRGIKRVAREEGPHWAAPHWHIWNSSRHTAQSYGFLIHFTATDQLFTFMSLGLFPSARGNATQWSNSQGHMPCVWWRAVVGSISL